MNTSGNHTQALTATQYENIVIIHNKAQDREHKRQMKKHKNETDSINLLLSNYNELYNELFQHFPNIGESRNKKKYIEFNGSYDKYIYYYDKKINNKESFKKEVLKFIISELLYNNLDEEDQKDIFLISYYFIKRGFKTEFKILNKETFKNNICSINTLYNYIIHYKDKNKKNPFINFDIYHEPEQTENKETLLKNCCICYEEYEEKNNFIKCRCNVEICLTCFENINNCPLCRFDGIEEINEEDEGDNRTISFKYNNQDLKNIVYPEDFGGDERFFFYYIAPSEFEGVSNNKIKIATFNIEHKEDLIFNHYEQSPLYEIMDDYFIADNLKDDFKNLSQKMINYIIDGCIIDNNDDEIKNLIGFKGWRSDDSILYNKLFDYHLNDRTEEDILNKSLYIKIGEELDNEIILTSEETFLQHTATQDNVIIDRYFNNEYTEEYYINDLDLSPFNMI
jgi:hypothetical protein